MMDCPTRRFTLLDGMILTAATAVGLGVARFHVGLYEGREIPFSDHPSRISLWVGFAWTVALIPLRLRAPRPPFRDIRRQPGLVMAIAVVSAGIFDDLLWTLLRNFSGHGSSVSFVLQLLVEPVEIAPWIAAGWIALAFSGGWRGEAGWIDRLGRLLGTLWIVAWIYSTVTSGAFDN